jgi:hypothetical protein
MVGEVTIYGWSIRPRAVTRGGHRSVSRGRLSAAKIGANLTLGGSSAVVDACMLPELKVDRWASFRSQLYEYYTVMACTTRSNRTSAYAGVQGGWAAQLLTWCGRLQSEPGSVALA